MTTRRDVLTGLAAVPIAAVPIAGSTACIAAAGPAETTLPASAAPAFLREIDRDVFREVQLLERLVAHIKAHILNANDPNPMIRYGALFDMRCNLGTAGMVVDGLRYTVEAQRVDAHEARLAEELCRDAEGRPHSPEFLARYRHKDATT